MRLIIRIIFSFIVLSIIYGQDPPSVKWNQIKTENYKVIFPRELNQEGLRVANTLEHIHPSINKTLSGKHKKIPVVLRNRSSIPNAFVSQAPWMSEWYNVPLLSKEMGTNEWYRDLAIHEGRHIVQTNYMNKGTSKLVKVLFGESSQSLFNSLLFPAWYWEGDAVGLETALTYSGRGRVPYFDIISRSLILNGKKFNYEQAFFGSYKMVYPNRYELGYFLTTHIKTNYGADAWPKIIDKTLRWPLTLNPLFPLSRSIRLLTGSSTRQIHHDTFYDLNELWSKQTKDFVENKVDFISAKPDIIANYSFPSAGINNTYFALKSGIADVPSIIKLKNGKEEIIEKIPFSSTIFGYHCNSEKAVWSFYEPDKRWTKLSWANIEVIDLKTSQRKVITSKKRLYNPNISKDSKKIVAVSFSQTRNSLLTILDSEDGEIIDQVEAPNQGSIMFPSWSKDGNKIVFTSQNFQGRAIYTYNINKRIFVKIKSETWEDISHPIFYKNFIIYESPYQGIDNLIAINIDTKEEHLITSRKLGAYYPSITNSDELLFSDYSLMGKRVAIVDLDSNNWSPIPKIVYDPVRSFQPMYDQEDGPVFDEPFPSSPYDIKPYKPISNLFNFHSRYIFDTKLDPTLGIQSDNILGTMTILADISYNQQKKTSKQQLNLIYKGLYPIMDIKLKKSERSELYGPYEQKLDDYRDTIKYKINEKWNENTIDLSVGIPWLNKINGINNKYFITYAGAKVVSRSNSILFYNFEKETIPKGLILQDKKSAPQRDGNIMPAYIEGTFISQNEVAVRDLRSKGWLINLYFGGMPFGGLWHGSQISSRFNSNINGFKKHHFISLLAHYETNDVSGNYFFPSRIKYPYGYRSYYFNNAWKTSIAYRLPLIYPDRRLLFGASYLKRVQGKLFFDAMDTDLSNNLLMSIGTGFIFDLGGFFDIVFPLSISLNYYYQPQTGRSGIQFEFE